MSETLSEPKNNPIPIGSPPAVTRRMFVAAIALGLALLVSFLFNSVLRLPNRSGKLLRASSGPCQASVRFPSGGSGRQTVSAEPDARKNGALLFRIHSLSECLPDDFE